MERRVLAAALGYMVCVFLGRSACAEGMPVLATTDESVAPKQFTESEAVEKGGVAVVIQQDVKKVFAVDEPLILKVLFKNTTGEAIVLPQGAVALNWQLVARDVGTGKVYTGGGFLPGFDGGRAELGPRIEPGETFEAPVVFEMYHFFEGELDHGVVRERIFREQIAAVKANKGEAVDLRHPLPVGRYKVSVNILYPKAAAGDGVWGERSLMTKAVEVEISEQETISGRLLVNRYYLERAFTALNKENEGGKLDKAIAGVRAAIREQAEAAQYVSMHKDIDVLPAGLIGDSPRKLPAELSVEIPVRVHQKAGMMEAMYCLNRAQRTFFVVREVPQEKKGFWAPLIVIPELDGHRDELMKRIAESGREVVATVPEEKR